MTAPFSTRLLLPRPLAVIDVETTSLSPAAARVVEVAALKLSPLAPDRLFHTRVNSGEPIPPAATAVHGIADADVLGRPLFKEIARPLTSFLEGSDLAGYNLARFDLPVLAHEFARAGVPFPLVGRAVVDVYSLFARLHPRDLGAAVKAMTGRDHAGAHSAAADVRATADVLQALLRKHPDLPPDAAGLHRLLVPVDVGGRFRRDPGGAVVLGFGKYVGAALGEVASRDPGYLRWLLGTDLLDDAAVLIRNALRGGRA